MRRTAVNPCSLPGAYLRPEPRLRGVESDTKEQSDSFRYQRHAPQGVVPSHRTFRRLQGWQALVRGRLFFTVAGGGPSGGGLVVAKVWNMRNPFIGNGKEACREKHSLWIRIRSGDGTCYAALRTGMEQIYRPGVFNRRIQSGLAQLAEQPAYPRFVKNLEKCGRLVECKDDRTGKKHDESCASFSRHGVEQRPCRTWYMWLAKYDTEVQIFRSHGTCQSPVFGIVACI